jgi:hypothetical protein
MSRKMTISQPWDDNKKETQHLLCSMTGRESDPKFLILDSSWVRTFSSETVNDLKSI